jgi:hypothetical protein
MGCETSVGSKKPHDPCDIRVGDPTCGDNQLCYAFHPGNPECLLYCDLSRPDRGCPDPELCHTIVLGAGANAATVHLCAVGHLLDGG